MQKIIVSTRIDGKLDEKHNVTVEEVSQCFDNKCGVNLIDDREDHRTDPATLWFIAETNTGRILKVIFVYRDGYIYLKSAYEPSAGEIAIYDAEGK